MTRRINIQTRPSLDGFAAACYDMNSISEMIDALSSEPDESDCKSWNLSKSDYREALALALKARLYDYEND